MTQDSQLGLADRDLTMWPPGTIKLEDMTQSSGNIILHPVPTADPNDPLNWSKLRKIVNFSLVCYYALMIFVILDIGTVIYGDLNTLLGFSFDQLNQSFAANTAGLAVGCIFSIPFALKYGRRPVYLISVVLNVALSIWQAKMNTVAELYAINVLSGLAGSVSETIVQMTIADLFFVHQRGTLNGIYLVMVNMGAFLAPVAAGYSAASQGWRWIWWWCAIFTGVAMFGFIFFFEETKYTPLLSARAPTLHHSDQAHSTKSDASAKDPIIDKQSAGLCTVNSNPEALSSGYQMKSYRERLAFSTPSGGGLSSVLRHTYQPFIILFTFPGVAYTALIYGSLLAWFSVMLTTLSIWFSLPPYNFSSAGIGLLNLGPFIGSLIGLVYGGPLSDIMILKLAKRNNGIYEPEMRLYLLLPCMFITPAGFFLYGYTLAQGYSWIVPAIGTAIFGVGFSAFSDVSLTYLIDCYKEITGDALVGVAFVRNAFATIIVMALTPWIDGVGLQNMFIMCTVLSFALFALTVPMLIYGKRCRTWSAARYERMAARQFTSRDL